MSDESSRGIYCPLPDAGDETIQLAHGGGGRMTQRLIDDLFRPAFADSAGDLTHDGAVMEIAGQRLAFTTDSFVVRPLFFPGGDIGTLAVNGTVNDLAMCGAEPICLSVGMVLEEGLPIAELHRIVRSMQAAATAAGVRLVTGDTKVVERGRGDGIYINTAGIGRVWDDLPPVSPQAVQLGDVVIVSGDIGRHGIAVMAAREELAFEPPVTSDCKPLAHAVHDLIDADIALHCLRDPTRGGLATALIEIAEASGLTIRLDETAIPVSEPVRGACELLGLDQLYVANEGRFIAIVPSSDATCAVATLRQHGAHATTIGHIECGASKPGVVMDTLGGSRVLDRLSGEQLPRIC